MCNASGGQIDWNQQQQPFLHLCAGCSLCTSGSVAVSSLLFLFGICISGENCLSILAGTVWSPDFYEIKARVCCACPWVAQLSEGWEPWAFSISLSTVFLKKKKNTLWASVTELSCWEINFVWMSISSRSEGVSWKAASNTQIFEKYKYKYKYKSQVSANKTLHVLCFC